MIKLDYEIECAAASIVHHTNQENGTGIEQRQKTNDDCIDWAINRIKRLMIEVLSKDMQWLEQDI